MTAGPIAVVTGGAGFLGSHMVDLLLARDFRVRVIDTLVSGREANLRQHAGSPHLAVDSHPLFCTLAGPFSSTVKQAEL